MQTRFLTLVRHAKSSWNNEGQSDHDRVLNERGRKDAPVMAQRLVDQNCIPDFILISTANRARQTAGFLIDAFGLSAEQVQFDRQLYLASPNAILNAVSGTNNEHNHVMVVAHNPGLEQLCNELARQELPPMPTLAVRHFSYQSYADAELIFNDYPKKLQASG